MGRNGTGATLATAVVAPVKRPAAPRPEIARPTITAADVGATPHTKDPISKIAKAIKKTHFTLK